jgi:hypothetical protein
MTQTFTRIVQIDVPTTLYGTKGSHLSPDFSVTIHADGIIPFAQVIVWRSGEQLCLCRAIASDQDPCVYIATVPPGALRAGKLTIQAEGCKQADLTKALGDDWIKTFATLEFITAEHVDPNTGGIRFKSNFPAVVAMPSSKDGIKIYFGIHKHMHQPYYRTAESGFWSGENDEIFGTRRGAYVDYLVDAIERYIGGDLPHAGLSTSYSGSLIEQLDRCGREGLAHGNFSNWSERLKQGVRLKTALGHPRIDFAGFGFFHPLMPLIPERDIIRQIELHRRVIEESFGVEASRVLFPPETAFHVRMIPALVKSGIKAVIYDSIHRFRACKDYPYGGIQEGMLPPNRAEQENPAVNDWLQLQNVWAGSLISPSLLRPSYLRYVDPEGIEHKIIGVPAERYIGNEDARGGFGALQYPSVLGQLYDRIVQTGSFDPKHPPFFLLHSDGDNYGGGTDSYYRHNTDGLVDWLRNDQRFELTTVLDYLERFPVDESSSEHVEPGSWSGADNGDPQFIKWFSRWDHDYSPDLNSWAVLTSLQNLVHTGAALFGPEPAVVQAERLLLMAETSCYWYWTGQQVWDAQVTEAANLAVSILANRIDSIKAGDRTGPTIFPPWTSPTNPGGKAWGQGCLVDAKREGTLHTLIADMTKIRSATVVMRTESGERRIPLRDLGPYPTQTGAVMSAHHFTTELPVGLGDVRYYIEAVDERGNMSRGALERIYLP